MKRAAILFFFVLASSQLFAQVKIYKDGTLQAEGLFLGTAANVIHVRTFDGSNFAKRSFFQNSLDSIVVLDSANILMMGTDKFQCPLVLRYERRTFDFRLVSANKIDTSNRAFQAAGPAQLLDERQVRLQKAQKHADKAQASLVGAICFGFLTAVLVREVNIRSKENNSFNSSLLIGGLSGAVSFVFLLNAVDQHAKAKSYRIID